MAGGFSTKEVEALQHIKDECARIFTYQTDEAKWKLADYWADDKMLLGAIEKNAPIDGDCEEYAMLTMRKAIEAGFKARLVVCLTELKGGHCICEVVCQDGTEAYYFDNRRRGLSTRAGLTGYFFYSASPWCPQPGDTRCWTLINLPAH